MATTGNTSINANIAVANQFYRAFQARQADEMATCYHAQVTFSDPVFPQLKGREASNMWFMLCQASPDLAINFAIESAAADTVIVNWDAWYTFSKTKRKVHNRVRSQLTLKDGKIIGHLDRFDLWRWSRQALGLPGWLLGWTPFLKRSIQKTARLSLQKFVKKSSDFQGGGTQDGRST